MMPSRSWTAEEDEMLRLLAGEESSREIAQRIGCTYDAVSRRRMQLGIKARAAKASARWTANQVETLLQGVAQRWSAKEIGGRTGRDAKSVSRKVAALGLTRNLQCCYTSEDESLIYASAGQRTVRELADMLGRTRRAIESKAMSLEVKLKPESNARFWNADEEAVLRLRVAARVPSSMIACELGRTKHSVKNRMRLLAVASPLRRRFTQADECAIRGAAGVLTVAELAELLNRSYRTMAWKARNMGVALKPDGARELEVPKRGVDLKQAVRMRAAGAPAAVGAGAAAKVKPKRVPQISGPSQLTYCPDCGGPVVNTPQRLAEHRQRLHSGMAASRGMLSAPSGMKANT